MRSAPIRAIYLAVAVTVALMGLPAPAPVSAVGGTVSGLFLDGEPGDWVSSGHQWAFVAPAFTIVPGFPSPDHNFVSFRVAGSDLECLDRRTCRPGVGGRRLLSCHDRHRSSGDRHPLDHRRRPRMFAPGRIGERPRGSVRRIQCGLRFRGRLLDGLQRRRHCPPVWLDPVPQLVRDQGDHARQRFDCVRRYGRRSAFGQPRPHDRERRNVCGSVQRSEPSKGPIPVPSRSSGRHARSFFPAMTARFRFEWTQAHAAQSTQTL